ncbi:MAG: hypothetical protein M3R55_05190 [Acidobacteriota bacterium]|nr:hypothetical protein [Acidobacteriota bacterium]
MDSTFRRTLREESGIALVSALLILLLMSSLMVGFTALATSDTKMRTISGARTQAFYAAHAGLEQLTADLGNLFSANFAPTCATISALTATTPELAGVEWQEPDGDSGYRIDFACVGTTPQASTLQVESGPFEGFLGLVTPYTMSVTAHLTDGSEASLERSLQTVAIPVFQFGMFSETDLSFFAGPAFNFGGRVHTNGNLFLAADPGPLTMSDRVTAFGEVIRSELSNLLSTAASHSGAVNITTGGSSRPLTRTEGSRIGGLTTGENEPLWTNLSTSSYNYYLRNGRTGAKRLDLPLTTFGATPIDLIRRPVVAEDTANPDVLSQRFFMLASLRILLSDTAAEITNLPTVSAGAPVQLNDISVSGLAGYAITATRPPFAVSAGSAANGDRVPLSTPLLGGFLKIEMQNAANNWQDVTLEILNLGIAGGPMINPAGGEPACAETSPDAVVRLQRFRDLTAAACPDAAMQTVQTNYWPNVLYDAREGLLRDGHGDTTPPRFSGAMHYIELDARNLSRWFQGGIGASGANALNVNGYTVYFSDRRTNKNAGGAETGEFGYEDIINRASGGAWNTGVPNGAMETAEDLNGSGALDTYGETPIIQAGMTAPLTNALRPWHASDNNGDAINDPVDRWILRRNPAVFFRRALKLVNGAQGNLVAPGLTIASENPVYIQGHWNASAAGFGNPHVATAVLADSVTMLSGAFNDRNSFLRAHDRNNRDATTTWYRVAILAGKGLSFQQIAGAPADYGTDGGAHNFLRYIEDWGGQTLNYRGSIASMFTSRQGVGTYKCCSDVYSPPSRGYNFDTDFLTPALLPPRTPMFRDVNTTGFAQIIRPK